MNSPINLLSIIQLVITLNFLLPECLEKMNNITVKSLKKQLLNSVKKMFLSKETCFREGDVTTIYRNHGAFIDGIVFLRRDDLGEKFKTLKVGQKIRYKRSLNMTFWQATDAELICSDNLDLEKMSGVQLKQDNKRTAYRGELVTNFLK